MNTKERKRSRTVDYAKFLEEKLRDPEMAAGYLTAALDEGEDVFLLAVRDVAEAERRRRPPELTGAVGERHAVEAAVRDVIAPQRESVGIARIGPLGPERKDLVALLWKLNAGRAKEELRTIVEVAGKLKFSTANLGPESSAYVAGKLRRTLHCNVPQIGRNDYE